MPGMVLEIGANVRGATDGIKQVSLGLREQETVLKDLRYQYAYLDAEQRKSYIGKEMAYDIRIASAELQKLKSESGTAFGALGSGATKALSALRNIAYVLPGIGVAGILGGLTNLLLSIGDSADETAKKLSELIKPIEGIRDAASAGSEEELAKVRALSIAVLDQTKSYGERNNALNQLKDINRAYFGDLSLEQEKLGLVKEATEKYTEAIINQAIIKAFSDDIGKVAVELTKQEAAFNKATQELQKYGVSQKGLNALVQVFNDADKSPLSDETKADYQELFKFNNRTQTQILDAARAYDKQAGVVQKLRNQIYDLRKAIQDAVGFSLDLKPLKDPKEVKVKVKKIELSAGDIEVSDIGNEVKTPDATAKVKLNIFGEQNEDFFKRQIEAAKRHATELRREYEKLADTISGVVAPAFTSFFAAIVENRDPLKAFFKSIGESVQQLIGQIVQAALRALILKAITGGPTSNLASIASGFNFGRRAAGGPVAAGVPYLVGEQRAEIFVPSTTGRIVPNTGSSGVSGNAMSELSVTGRITGEGERLVVLIDRIMRKNNRYE